MRYRVRFLDPAGDLLREAEETLDRPFAPERIEEDGRFEYVGFADGCVIYRRVR